MEAIIENDKIVNADKLRRYWQERLHREYLLSRAWRDNFKVLNSKSETEQLSDRIDNLEAMSALPGQLPRQFHDEIQELRGRVNYLQNKVNELSKRGKNPPKDRL